MKKPGKYLNFYMHCMGRRESGERIEMPAPGLCYNFPYEDIDLFRPINGIPSGPWAGERNRNTEVGDHRFNETRQTIVLFLAAMNGEL